MCYSHSTMSSTCTYSLMSKNDYFSDNHWDRLLDIVISTGQVDDLSTTALDVLNRISDNGDPTTYVSLVQLHKLKQKTGKKYSSVFRAISELVQAEIIIHRYDIDASVYMLHPRLIHTLTRMVS